jgi:hypothetical protein
MWRARFGRGFGPAVRETAKCMNEARVGGSCENGKELIDSIKGEDRLVYLPVKFSVVILKSTKIVTALISYISGILQPSVQLRSVL